MILLRHTLYIAITMYAYVRHKLQFLQLSNFFYLYRVQCFVIYHTIVINMSCPTDALVWMWVRGCVSVCVCVFRYLYISPFFVLLLPEGE